MNIFEDDGGTAGADELAADKVKERATALAEQEPPEAFDDPLGGAPVIDLTEVDDEPEKPDRKERRLNRYREVQEDRDRLDRRNRELESMLDLQRRQQQPPQSAPQENPHLARYDHEIRDVLTQQEMMAREIRAKAEEGPLTSAQTDDFRRRAHDLEIKKGTLIARLARAETSAEERQLMADAAVQAQLYSKYKDVLDSPDARAYAEGVIRMRSVTERGRKNLEQITEDAMAETRRVVLRTGAPRRTETERSRYGGGPKSAGGGAPDTGAVTQVVMHKDFRKMADEMYPHIKDRNERMKKWASGPGRRVMEASRRQSKLSG